MCGRGVDAWNRGDIDAYLALFDPECEVVFRPDAPEPGPYHGHDELRRWVDGFLAAWESHRVEVMEVLNKGDDVFAALHLTGRGTGSGIGMDETEGHVFTVREGKIVRWRNFKERKEALEAAGLSE